MAMTPVYKGYKGWISRNPDPESGMYHGKVLGIADVVTFQGSTVQEAWNEFKVSIDNWLEFKRMIEIEEECKVEQYRFIGQTRMKDIATPYPDKQSDPSKEVAIHYSHIMTAWGLRPTLIGRNTLCSHCVNCWHEVQATTREKITKVEEKFTVSDETRIKIDPELAHPCKTMTEQAS